MRKERVVMKKRLGCVLFFLSFIFLNFYVCASIRNIQFDEETEVTGVITDFNWYRNGIKLTGNTTFANPFPIGSRGDYTAGLNLHDGEISRTLTLSSDLYLGDKTFIRGSGYIDGTELAGQTHAIILNGDVQLSNGTIIITDDLVINGGGNVLDFNSYALSVADGKTLTLKNIVLRNVTAGSIVMVGASKLYLDNVVIELSGNYTFATGTLYVYGNVVVTGKGRSFILNGDIVFAADSILYFDVGTTFNYDSGTTAFDPTSVLHFNGCTVDIATAGLTVGSSLILFENKVTIQGGNTLNASAADIRVLSGARIELDTDAIFKVN